MILDTQTNAYDVQQSRRARFFGFLISDPTPKTSAARDGQNTVPPPCPV